MLAVLFIESIYRISLCVGNISYNILPNDVVSTVSDEAVWASITGHNKLVVLIMSDLDKALGIVEVEK